MARILIVDDNGMIRQLMRLILESGDHVVEEAADGELALRHELSGFDLVITDLYMPKVSGFEVIGRARAAGIRAIAVSGGDRLGGQDPLAAALEQGAALALRKPFSVPALLPLVEECLGADPPSPRVIEYSRT